MAEKTELTRREAAKRLDCSESSVCRFEREGHLVGRRENADRHSLVFYTAESVEKWKKQWRRLRAKRVEKIDSELVATNVRGIIAAKVIPMFERGITNLAELCVASEADPMIIVQLYEVWKLGLDGAIAAKRRAKQEEAERDAAKAARDERRQERWIDMRLQVAKLEKKPGIALGRLEHPPLTIDDPNGKKRSTG